MFSVFNTPINAGKEAFQKSYEMTYKFKDFKYNCAEEEEDEEEDLERGWDYDEYLRMDMKSTI